jgi:RepB DNA-primase from phage plasmid
MFRRRKWPRRPLPYSFTGSSAEAGLPYRRGLVMNLNPPREFLTRCFTSEETIALLLRSEVPDKVMQRIVTAEVALARRYLAWLAHENASGANIYVAANPLRPGSRKRTKESIASVRHLYIDIDTDGDTRLAMLLASDAVPAPNAILSTSPGKYQVLWQVNGFDFDLQEMTLKQIAIAFGGDPACTDCNRVLRVPGLQNWKYDPAAHVTVEYPSASVWTPSDFRLTTAVSNTILFERSIPSRGQPGQNSTSERDWAWVSSELAHGREALQLTWELTSRRSDKTNPLYYAQRTVDVASARLWLLEGTPLGDVIAMLESRRRFELSPSVCTARAREIAGTAQRMIVRGKNAPSSPPKENRNATT